jgi:SH3-like domain-containing protein
MASGRLLLAATLALSTCAVLPAFTRAEDAAPAEGDAKHVFQGEVNANAVQVRSRPSEDAYATMKLKKGDRVTVVGIKGPWLKIEPPDGSFAYVAKSFIELHGDGTVGRATRDTLAHAGSQLNELAVVTMATIHQGEEVEITGQYNEYFKIKPPKDSYVFINKQFVDPVQTLPPAETDKAKPQSNDDDSQKAQPPEMPIVTRSDATPTTRPSSETVADANAAPATTEPSGFNSIAEYEKLEDQFTSLNKKSIGEQPLPDLIAGYQKVIAADDLPSSMRSIAEIRLSTLKARNEAREKFLAVEENQKKMTAARQALAAERQEIEERIKKNDVQVYAAVGTLRPSSLQIGQGMLYRLTDPATGRTICYIRTTEPKFGPLLGQFIGVRGAIMPDAQLKSMIENPAEVAPVDQTQVNGSIAAQIIPPSLLHYVPPAPANAPGAQAPAPAPAAVNIPTPAPAPSSTPAHAAGGNDQASTSPEPQ